MQINILNIRKSPNGYPIGYGQVGDKFGEVWCSAMVKLGVNQLNERLVVKDGRFVVQLMAEPLSVFACEKVE